MAEHVDYGVRRGGAVRGSSVTWVRAGSMDGSDLENAREHIAHLRSLGHTAQLVTRKRTDWEEVSDE